MADWVQKMKDTAQPHVPEPVTAVGLLQPAGTWGASALRMVSPFAGSRKQRKADVKAGGLASGAGVFSNTKMALFALTADKLYAFSAKPKGTSWKVGDQLGCWERRDLKVTTEPGKLATKVSMDVASTGDHYELEATTALQRSDFTTTFLAELTGS